MVSDFYENLLRATDNTNDITNEKYGTVTKIDNNLCNVKEEDSDLEHVNVPILNGIECETGDKIVIGFVNNSIYDPIIIGNLSRGIFNQIYKKDEVDKKIEDIISGDIDLEQYMKKQEYIDDLGNQTETSEFLKALDNTIIAITGRGDDF